MTKGVLGLNLTAVAVIAFVLCFCGTVIPLLLVIGYALLIEKNEWLSKQTLQALYLYLTYAVAYAAINWLFTFFNIFGYSTFLYGLSQFLYAVLLAALLVLAVFAALRVAKEQDANLPIIGDWADYTLGKIAKVKAAPAAAPQAVVYQQPVYTAPAAPVAAAPIAAAVPAADAAAKTTKKATAAADDAAKAAPTAAPETWVCACGRESFGKFCMGCGKPRPS